MITEYKYTPYKYPELVHCRKNHSGPINWEMMNAQYNTLIPALGMVLLERIQSHVMTSFARTCKNMVASHNAFNIISEKYIECKSDYQNAMKEYSEL